MIPQGCENWKPSEKLLSVAQISKHLLDSDSWLFKKIKYPRYPFSDTQVEMELLPNRQEYEKLVQDLIDSGKQQF